MENLIEHIIKTVKLNEEVERIEETNEGSRFIANKISMFNRDIKYQKKKLLTASPEDAKKIRTEIADLERLKKDHRDFEKEHRRPKSLADQEEYEKDPENYYKKKDAEKRRKRREVYHSKKG